MKLNFFRLWIAAITLMVGWAPSPVEAAQITPQYDAKPEYQKYWTANFKNQVSEACRFLGGYINDNQTVTITITIDSAMSNGTFAYANMSKAVGSTNTADKFIAQSGEVAFNPSFYDEATKDWKGNNILLMTHEILHCLGFSNTINAFKKHISTGTFTGPKTKLLNNGVAPGLASDNSHFVRVTTDPAGVVPRMMEGGGQILSMLDLAVLADIGYNIPVVNSATKATCLGFKLNPLNSRKYNQLQYKATTYVAGGCGNDEINGNDSAESIILRGEGGDDTLISGNNITVMMGDDLRELAKGNDGSDIYRIETIKAHVIVGLGAKDKIQIPPDIVDLDQIKSLTVTAADNTYDTYLIDNKPLIPFKATIGWLTLYVYNFKEGATLEENLAKVKQKLLNSSLPAGSSSTCRWDETEISNWYGVWFRRGSSNTYDATWALRGHNNVTAELTITRNGNAISIFRKGTSDGTNCQYTGTVAADGKTVTGKYTCGPGVPTDWRATIGAGCN